MGDFYQVIKTIKGHKYLYKQRTFRKSGRVCTESHYIGPAGAGDVARVSAEQSIRKHAPTHAQVAALVKLLADPTKAAGTAIKGWGEKPVVNTTFQRAELIDRQLASLGVRIIEHENAPGAFYSPSDDAVVVPTGNRFHEDETRSATEGFYSTLLHEVAHWTAQETRLNRKSVGVGLARTSMEHLATYAREELVAEATATLVTAKLNLPLRDKSQSALYFQGYLSAAGNKEEALQYVMNEVHRAASYILTNPQLLSLRVAYGLL